MRHSQHGPFLQENRTEREIEHESWTSDYTERDFKDVFWLAVCFFCK